MTRYEKYCLPYKPENITYWQFYLRHNLLFIRKIISSYEMEILINNHGPLLVIDNLYEEYEPAMDIRINMFVPCNNKFEFLDFIVIDCIKRLLWFVRGF